EGDLSATVLTRERALSQAIEILSISLEADAIETDLTQRKIRFPSVFSIFTAGLKPPTESSQELAKYGVYPYQGFFPAGIPGHECKISITNLTGDITMMNFMGRSIHVYESNDLKQAPIVAAHGLRLIKELARRQRSRGIDPAIILTFLTGADFEVGNINIGEIAVLMDDTELNNTNHSAAGAHDLLDKYDGNRFIGKAGNAGDPEIAKQFKEILGRRLFPIHWAMTVGTAGAPEFQSVFERVWAKIVFENALETELLREIIQPVFGQVWERFATLLYNMSITPELAVFRQLKKDEPRFRVLPLGLITDLVGNKDSLTIDHGVVYSSAVEKGQKYMPSIIELATKSITPFKTQKDFSIQAQLMAEGVYK
ncbi:MAG: hypothetical protein U1C50_03035, partial [Patescibacteria group bacterium]|nr:hypothetical protein [Patescibacteria group bacterium]